jgi:hypothetical protein
MPDPPLTALQIWWRAERDLLDDARDAIGPDDWPTFVSMLTAWVAAESARLDLETKP